MKVFISWSGAETKSLAVAKVLDAWIPTVLNAVEPWISSRGLSAGLKWNQQLEKELDDTSFGIIVVTPWNQHSQWLNFEAGALSKRVNGSEARVTPLLIDFPSVANLIGPLSGYQAVQPVRTGIKELVVGINEALGDHARKLDALERAFDVCWPDLETSLKNINDQLPSESDPANAPTPQPASVDEGDKIDQILIALRELQRSDVRLKSAIRVEGIDANAIIVNDAKHTARRNSQSKRVTERLWKKGIAVLSIEQTMDGTTHMVLDRPLSSDEENELLAPLNSQGEMFADIQFDYVNLMPPDPRGYKWKSSLNHPPGMI